VERRLLRLVEVTDASPDQRGVDADALAVPTACATALEVVAATWDLPPDAYAPERHSTGTTGTQRIGSLDPV
jgi:hypothetical protein